MQQIKCDFCDSLAIKKQVLFEDDCSYLLLPKRPVFKYHGMIVPKKHVATFEQLEDFELQGLREMVRHITRKFNTKEGFKGYNIFSNNGDPSIGQNVKHFHMHIFLRHRDEEISPYKILNDDSLRHTLSEEEYNSLVRKLRAALGT